MQGDIISSINKEITEINKFLQNRELFNRNLFKFKEEFIMEDKTLVCKDCGAEFVFTVGEQEFYKEKGFDNEPKRCMACRRARKQQNNR